MVKKYRFKKTKQAIVKAVKYRNDTDIVELCGTNVAFKHENENTVILKSLRMKTNIKLEKGCYLFKDNVDSLFALSEREFFKTFEGISNE